jgi:hypothetical protein
MSAMSIEGISGAADLSQGPRSLVPLPRFFFKIRKETLRPQVRFKQNQQLSLQISTRSPTETVQNRKVTVQIRKASVRARKVSVHQPDQFGSDQIWFN